MKTILRNTKLVMILAFLPALLSAAQAQAVDYKSTYKGSRIQTTIGVATTATAPTVGFQSTSPYSTTFDTEQQPMLNADGTVNEGAYMGSPRRPGIRRTDSNINNPGDPDEEKDDGNTPLGDGLWVLLMFAGAYAISKVSRTRKEGFAQ